MSLLKVKDIAIMVNFIETFPKFIHIILTSSYNGDQLESQEDLSNKISEIIKETWNNVKKNSWRSCCKIMAVIFPIQKYFSPQDFNEFFLKEAVETIKEGNNQTRKSASKLFCDLLLHNYHSSTRTAFMSTVIALSTSASCYERIGYTYFVEIAVRCFSREFLANNQLLEHFLELSNDKITNLRLRFINASQSLYFNVENKWQGLLMERLNNQQNDKDKEIKKKANKTVAILKSLAVDNDKRQTELDEINAGFVLREKVLLLNVLLDWNIMSRKAKKKKDHFQQNTPEHQQNVVLTSYLPRNN